MLCTSPQEQLPDGGITCIYSKQCSRKGQQSDISGFLQQTFLGFKPQQQMEIFSRSELTEQISEIRNLQNGDTRKHKDFLVERRMGNVHRFQEHVLPYTNKPSVQEIPAFSHSGSILPIQSSTLCSVHYSSGNGIRIHQYLDDWLVRATSHQACLQLSQNLVALCQVLGRLVNMEKSELESKQIFNFIGNQYNLREGKVRPTLECGQTLNLKLH